ncbi:bone morphogenetic protein 1-like [Amphiura filiformis]|uniref:bone morphogenetic protein 1-like n=1 Tax=Amphiura filiformis TaxID=82378 RepID=UPI003B224C13
MVNVEVACDEVIPSCLGLPRLTSLIQDEITLNLDIPEYGFCGDRIINLATTQTAILISPNYPLRYPESVLCQWTITAPENSWILIQFIDFATYIDTYLDVGYGDSFLNSTRVFRLGGDVQANSLIMDNNYAWIEFLSEAPDVERGFKLIILQTDNSSKCEAQDFVCSSGYGCWNQNVTCDGKPACMDESDEKFCNICGKKDIFLSAGDNVNITSPLFPSQYPMSFECSWFITASDNAYIVVFFVTFTTEIFYDFLEINFEPYSKTNRTVITVTGETAPNVLRSNTSELLLHFKSDKSVTDIGFVLEVYWDNSTDWTCPTGDYNCLNLDVCLDKLLECDGFNHCWSDEDHCDLCQSGISHLSNDEAINITSPLYPNMYPLNLECTWVVATANTQHAIQISFMEFNLENRFDFLEVGYGHNISVDSTVTRLSGEVVPMVIVHDGYMWLRFISDESVPDLGFFAYLQISFTERGYDILTVKETDAFQNNNLLALLTGTVKITRIKTPMKEVEIEFASDRTGSRRGFHLELDLVNQMASYCTTEEVDCKNGLCADITAKCNGFDDCGNMEDETTCVFDFVESISCPESYLCDAVPGETLMCVPKEVVCDGTVDCQNGDDEIDCGMVDYDSTY